MAKRNTKTSFFKPNVPKRITNLNWNQAKKRFPLLNPYGDIDRDGVRNFRDCKPFNIKRQGKENDDEEISVGFEDIYKLKTVGDVQKLEESIFRIGKKEDE